ncbi:unnamed protein product [Mytilus edulis]|uniref:Uncharacterized protein n=1 Tax=Mytilus edulis TaxID=6550 RepID=A0A8S3R421_MYTED|nr:unnamed protein product [Mytilus edulis]
MDELIKANKNTIASGKKMKKIVQKAKEFMEYYDDKDMQEIAEYYVYLLEEVEYHEETSVIDDERYYLIRELVDPKGPRQRELLLKKQNVVRQFFDIMGDKLLKRNSKQSPIVKAKERVHIITIMIKYTDMKNYKKYPMTFTEYRHVFLSSHCSDIPILNSIYDFLLFSNLI